MTCLAFSRHNIRLVSVYKNYFFGYRSSRHINHACCLLSMEGAHIFTETSSLLFSRMYYKSLKSLLFFVLFTLFVFSAGSNNRYVPSRIAFLYLPTLPLMFILSFYPPTVIVKPRAFAFLSTVPFSKQLSLCTKCLSSVASSMYFIQYITSLSVLNFLFRNDQILCYPPSQVTEQMILVCFPLNFLEHGFLLFHVSIKTTLKRVLSYTFYLIVQ